MSTLSVSLWPPSATVDVRSPASILREQEPLLARQTKGLLHAKVTSAEVEGRRMLSLEVAAPPLDYHEEILRATHAASRLYPVTLTARCFAPDGADIGASPLRPVGVLGPDQRRASSPEEFIRLLGEVLASDEVVSLLASLIARINEQEGRDDGAASNGAA